jgi:thiol-disulfide isomerase/thioredoxin
MIAASVLSDREVLYFFKQDGCEACAAAEPELYRFMAKHPTVTVLVMDAGGPFPDRLGLKIRATPTYVFRHGAGMEAKIGVLKHTDVEKWVKKLGGAL